MRRFIHACISLLVLGMTPLQLAADSFEWLLDGETQKTFRLEETCNPCLALTIENRGAEPIKNCFPQLNFSPCLSIDSLARRLANEEHPLRTLYQLWSQSVSKSEVESPIFCRPLDLIYFRGRCSPITFSSAFIKLCGLLGMETRLAHVHNRSLYDFGLGGEWSLLDVDEGQMYLSLDNERMVSSEEIMDDPFLLLRSKHDKQGDGVDFRDSWRRLAHFEILEPSFAAPIEPLTECLEGRSLGVDLYPRETLVMKNGAADTPSKELSCRLEHALDLDSRNSPLVLHYAAPFPIRILENRSSTTLAFGADGVILQPGERLCFEEPEIFELSLAFQNPPSGRILITGLGTAALFPSPAVGENRFELGVENNPSLVRCCYEFAEKAPVPCSIRILNEEHDFGYASPSFHIDRDSIDWGAIWWQISPHPQFEWVPSNLEQIEPFKATVTLPLISETFLNSEQTYYFRIRGCKDGTWGAWSPAFSFFLKKPCAVIETEWESLERGGYELNWERYAEASEDEPIEYWVFGSNSLDFIPSIYFDKQINAISHQETAEEEAHNLVGIVEKPKITLKGGLAYYRIIAKKSGQYSIPSPLIRLYDQDLVLPCDVLQLAPYDGELGVAKRMLLPPPPSHATLPLTSKSASRKSERIPLLALMRTAASVEHMQHAYELPEVSEEIWEEVRPYLLPPNHPAWAKLNRIFCEARATQNHEAFRRAGFKRWRPGRWSRVSASSHPEIKEYFIKAYCDCETGIIYDWKKWIHRIKGAETVRECIKDYQLSSYFKVPRKWIYPLPRYPAPSPLVSRSRKNFILVAENMRIEEHDKNEKLYKHMDKKRMKGLYTVLQVCGLYDSVYCFNIPFCKDGKMAVIDTEYHHKWPVPFEKLSHKFSKSARSYWKELTHHGGAIPRGENQPNPPRMDRRDFPGI